MVGDGMSMKKDPVVCTWEIRETRGLETAWVDLDPDGGGLAARAGRLG